jgi:hypothetical protein
MRAADPRSCARTFLTAEPVPVLACARGKGCIGGRSPTHVLPHGLDVLGVPAVEKVHRPRGSLCLPTRAHLGRVGFVVRNPNLRLGGSSNENPRRSIRVVSLGYVERSSQLNRAPKCLGRSLM